MTGLTSLYACDSKTGGNVGVSQEDSNQMGDNSSSGIVNANPNDTTGAAATEQTQTSVGNSDQRGETNNSKSTTTQNQNLPKEQQP